MKTSLTLLIVAGMLAGCGNTATKNSSSSAEPNKPGQIPITNLYNTNWSVKAVREAYSDATGLADLTEIMTTGLDDKSGTSPALRSSSSQFTYVAGDAADLNNVTQAFTAEATFLSMASPSGSIDGNATFHVAPAVPMAATQGNLQVLDLTPTFSLKRTTGGNDVISVSAGGNLAISKSGRRQDGKVERVLTGDVHRVLNSATDSNENFDYHFTYKGLKVVDSYVDGKLASRSLVGEVAMDYGYSVKFSDTVRSDVAHCLCPGSGVAIGSIPLGDEGDGAITFTFGTPCGEVAAKRLEANVFTGPSINANLVLQGCAVKAVAE